MTDKYDYIRYINDRLKKNCADHFNSTLLPVEAGRFADAVNDLLAELEQVKQERDALKEDILRAQDKANDMQTELLDNEVHQTCDYSLYCALCDALSDVVAWENKELLVDERSCSTCKLYEDGVVVHNECYDCVNWCNYEACESKEE